MKPTYTSVANANLPLDLNCPSMPAVCNDLPPETTPLTTSAGSTGEDGSLFSGYCEFPAPINNSAYNWDASWTSGSTVGRVHDVSEVYGCHLSGSTCKTGCCGAHDGSPLCTAAENPVSPVMLPISPRQTRSVAS